MAIANDLFKPGEKTNRRGRSQNFGSVEKEFYAQSEAVLARNGRLVYQTGAAIVSGNKPNRSSVIPWLFLIV